MWCICKIPKKKKKKKYKQGAQKPSERRHENISFRKCHSCKIPVSPYSEEIVVIIPPQTLFVVGYTVFTSSVRLCVRP